MSEVKEDIERYAKKLDLEAANLPELNVWEQTESTPPYSCPTGLANGFITTLKKILECLKATDIYEYNWHRYCCCLEFRHFRSPYFREGRILKCEKLPINKNLEGVICVGFDEELDYEDCENSPKPELIIFYNNKYETTDVYLFDTVKWRDALSEFFDINEIGRYKTLNKHKRTEQCMLFYEVQP